MPQVSVDMDRNIAQEVYILSDFNFVKFLIRKNIYSIILFQ